MKKILAILLALLMVLGFAGCASNNAETTNTTEAAKEEEKETFTIGYISPGPDTWYQRAEEGARWACEKAGIGFISCNSNRDSNLENTNIENLINEGVDAIVILSWNEAGCVTCAEKCKAAGIGCVVFDGCGVMKSHDIDITASVDFDWASMGATYVNWMNTTYAGEDYVFINGTEDSMVCQTVEKALKEASKAEGAAQFVDVRYGQYDPEKAANAVEDLVNSGLDFSLIGVINEDCAAAVITRLKDLGVADKYHVFAQNGSDTGVKLLNEGSLEFTIASSPGLEGAIAVFAALDGVKNGKTNQDIPCAIASVLPADANNPEKVIPWAVDDSWISIITANYPNYVQYLN